MCFSAVVYKKRKREAWIADVKNWFKHIDKGSLEEEYEIKWNQLIKNQLATCSDEKLFISYSTVNSFTVRLEECFEEKIKSIENTENVANIKKLQGSLQKLLKNVITSFNENFKVTDRLAFLEKEKMEMII